MLKKSLVLFLIAGMAVSCNVNKKTGQTKLDSQIKKVSYSLGVSMGSYYLKQGFDSIDVIAFADGLDASLRKADLQISEADANVLLQDFFKAASDIKGESMKKEGVDFLKENGNKSGVVTLPDGLQYTILKEGTGAMPKATDKVKVDYTGTLIDGTVFDSSVDRGEPATFPVTGVIKGWTEALQLMKVGAKWRLFVPYDLAYGERGAGQKIGPYSTLIFEVELLDIVK